MITNDGTRRPDAERMDDRASRLERQLEAAQQITHIGSWEWDVASNTVSWSDELYRIYGLEPQSCEITFETFLARVHPDDRDNTTQQVRSALEGGHRFEYPERILRPDGSIRCLETKGEVLRDATGSPLAMIGTCRDVTEERSREEQIQLHADIVRNVQIGLTVWSMEGITDARGARLVSFNAAAEAQARMALSKQVGRALSDIVPALTDGELPDLLTGVYRERDVRELAAYPFRYGTGDVRIFKLKAFPLPKFCVGLAADDVTSEERARKLEAGEQHIFEMVASDTPLSEVLVRITRYIEEQMPETIASILLLDEDGVRVRHGAAPRLPDDYNRAIEGASIGPRAGSCGTAMYRMQPVYVSDIESDPLWEDYRGLALAHGLRACWSTPVLAKDGRVLGSFALYYRRPGSPTDDDLKLIARASRITAIAIERRQLEQQLLALSAHVESVREDERTGIAREIHDELGQALTALKMDLAWLGRRAAEPGGIASAVVLDKVKAMSQMADDIIGQIRQISAQLRPGVLDDLGLSAAIEWQAQAFEQRTGTVCDVASNLGDQLLDNQLSTAVFRIFQEALTNVIRHANAQHVDVRLECADKWLTLEVEDDGCGIPPESITSPKSLGLLGMRERARRLGGALSISKGADGGTLLTLRVPVPESAA